MDRQHGYLNDLRPPEFEATYALEQADQQLLESLLQI